MGEEFVTHRREDGSYQPLKAHLLGVAELAGQFAQSIGSPREGRRTGKGHDVGKYSAAGQRRQRDPEHTHSVDHSTAGAQLAARGLRDIPAAFAIAGHHGGLPDKEALVDRMQKQLTGDMDPSAWRREIEMEAQTDMPDWVNRKLESVETAMYTRMLFSCLVDADFLDTEAALQGAQPRGGYDELSALLDKLRAHVAPWLQDPRDELCSRRNAVLTQCLRGGEQPGGLYTLTVPTGGGKTVASLAFALSHAVARGLMRVIYVIPYTSIIEQTARVFSEILGDENVLEHHSQVELSDDAGDADSLESRRRRLACENWDAPVIVTTAVQFFESMYASKTSRCRKLHNIARSVIIFDEAQTLPVTLLRPCVSAISELVRHYGATALLCTATQPALEGLFAQCAPELAMCEIAPDPDGLFDFFRRVHFAREGQLADEAVAARLCETAQVLCVVNSRKRARTLFGMLPEEGRYHLSTLMTAEDRERTLETIRKRLKANEPCRVVSTSLVEAGVDVDFPTVWREMAGLDSILQAAGRCNREGKRPLEESVVHIFTGEGRINDGLKLRIAPAEQVLAEYEDINTRPAIQAYFRKLLWVSGEDSLDKKGVMQLEAALRFREVAKAFRMIDADSYIVYIPTQDNAEDIHRLRLGMYSRALLRRLGRTAVSLPHYEYQVLADACAVEDHRMDGYGILLNADGYSPVCGLDVRCQGGSAEFV